MPSTTSMTGSAERWGPLWGSEARDWAANEDQQRPTYEEAIRQVGVEDGASVLDIGCGSGVFLRLAADRGARAYGLDASEALIEIARERVPDGDLRVGDMEALPWADDTFDFVTGFNSFFFADDMTAALREAGRVAKPGAPVVVQVWGRPEKNDLEAAKPVFRVYLPAPPPGSPPPHSNLAEPGVLERIVATAGLTPERTFDTSWAYRYEDDAALSRGMLAPGGLGVLAGERRGELEAAILEALAPYRTASGGYVLENEWHYLVARAA
ncbi:MAG TPA: class I SAM-dependent methyltransferase [Gaiellaceae bacterium]|jgi:SAM-dependent methyltransferase|nr:class I SAM-dependent methyltransferase [Gaiellaceae bacterium]